MEFLKEYDNEEKILLLGGLFSLFITFSYSINFFKVVVGFINYTETGIYSLFFCYINTIIWYCYSVLIEHELLQGCYYYSSWIAFVLLIFYLSFEYYDDKFDTLINFLITMIIYSTLYKIFIQMYDDEEKTKRFCVYTEVIFLISILHWSYKALINKNPRDINMFVGISLILYSCSLIIYGEVYQNVFILFTNFGGVIVGMIHIAVSFYLINEYPELDEFKAPPSLDIEIKSENKKVHPKNNKENEKISQNLYI